MHEMKEKLHDICEMKKRVIDWAKMEIEDGLSEDPQHIMMFGEIVDMIKDLAEAEKSCHEACYYESVVEAMDEYGGNPRMGFKPGRNAEGQYTSRGGYSDMNNRSDWRMPEHQEWARPGKEDMDYDERYGKPFNEFRKAKRHYTKTHAPEDKEMMKEHANEHMMETMTTIREIYDNADPELKKRMKADLSKLVGEMTV